MNCALNPTEIVRRPYTKTIASSASFDASRDPQLVINPPTVSGSSRVSVTGYHKVHVYPFHHDPSMDYHEGVDMDLADGSGTNYGDSYWNQTWPITVEPRLRPSQRLRKITTSRRRCGSARVDFRFSIRVLLLRVGSTGTGSSGLVAEGEDPAKPCRAGNMAATSRLWGSQRHVAAFKGALEVQSGLANMTPGPVLCSAHTMP